MIDHVLTVVWGWLCGIPAGWILLKIGLRRRLRRMASRVYNLEHIGDGYKQGYLDALRDVHEDL